MGDFDFRLYLLSIMALPFLIAVTTREGIRAYVADTLGDPTARINNRLSLNPFAHFDPVMTGLIPLLLFLGGAPFLIGGGKPLPIDPRHFKDARRGIILTSLAGPLGNLLLGIFFAYIARFSLYFGAVPKDWAVQMALWGVFLNSIFMVLSLIPVPPFDGGRALMFFLPREAGQFLEKIEPFGFFIFIGIVILIPELVVVPAQAINDIILYLVGV